MIAVYQADNLLEAQLVKGALESNGVTAFIAGEHFLPMMGHLQVMVDEDQAEHARDVVAEIRAAAPGCEPEPAEEPDPRIDLDLELAPRPI
jgi:hypothetical protein